jgi:hypothetical protein
MLWHFMAAGKFEQHRADPETGAAIPFDLPQILCAPTPPELSAMDNFAIRLNTVRFNR